LTGSVAAEDWGQPSGLIWALRFTDGVAAPCAEAEAADPVAGWTWSHYRLGDVRTLAVLGQLAGLPNEAHELFALRENRIQIVEEDGWVFGALPDLERDLSGSPQGEGRLIFAARGRRVITGRLHALRAVDDLRHAAERGRRLADPTEALAALIEIYMDRVEDIFDALGSDLSAIEDYVLTQPQDPRDSGLSGVRRRLARHRRELQGLRSALVRALGGRHGGRIEVLAERLPDLVALTEDIDREAAGLQDRARLLYEEIDTLINGATNRSMRTLTVISTLLIPPTLIVGAFGMNVPGIPFDKSPIGFALASGLCLVVVGGVLWGLRRMQMLP
jgi:Mg2+ and Co2+ transporter CorA